MTRPQRIALLLGVPLAVVAAAVVLVVAAAGGGKDDSPGTYVELRQEATPSLTDTGTRGVLGLRCGVATTFLRERYTLPHGRGCVILRVDANSGAEAAGLRIGDNIVEVDRMPVTSGRQFSAILLLLPDVATHTFVVQRGSDRLTLPVRLGDRADLPDNDPYFYYLRAKNGVSDGDYVSVIDDYTKAIELDPAFELPYLYRAEVQLDLSALTGTGIDAVLSDLDTVLRFDPEIAEVYSELGFIELNVNQDPSAAIEQFNRAVELDGCGTHVEAWDIDCAEHFFFRAGAYLLRLEPGDDLRAQADIDAIRDVFLMGPAQTLTRFELAFAHGDDETARSAAEEFVSMPLDYPNSGLGERQSYLSRVVTAETSVLDYNIGWFEYTNIGTPGEKVLGTFAGSTPYDPADVPDAAYVPHVPSARQSALIYQLDVPGLYYGDRLSWSLWRDEYQVSSSEEDAIGQAFQAVFVARRQLPPGIYELRVYADGNAVATRRVEVPAP